MAYMSSSILLNAARQKLLAVSKDTMVYIVKAPGSCDFPLAPKSCFSSFDHALLSFMALA